MSSGLTRRWKGLTEDDTFGEGSISFCPGYVIDIYCSEEWNDNLSFWTQNTQIAETTEFRRPFSRSSEDIDDLKTVSSQILEYRGDGLPQWIEDDQKRESFCSFITLL